MRVSEGAHREKVDESGATYYVHRLTPWPEKKPPAPPPRVAVAEGGGKCADPDLLHKVYTSLLGKLLLEPAHHQAIRRRGVDPDEFRRRGYRSLGKGRIDAATALIEAGLEEHFPRVPGFYVRERPGQPRCWSLKAPGGMIFPVRDVEGRIVGLQVRRDGVGGGKYAWLSSKRDGGAGPGSPVHHPLFDGDRSVCRVTEGAVKADVATVLSGVYTIGLPSVNAWRKAAKALRAAGAKTVRVAFDSDARTNRNVARCLAALVDDLLGKGFVVELELWDIKDGKGIDDLLAADKQPEVVAGEEAVRGEVAKVVADAEAADPPPGPGNQAAAPTVRERPTIVIDTDQRRVNDEAIATLATEQSLFHRGGMLVRLIRESRSPAEQARERVKRAEGSPRVLPVEEAILSEMMAAAADWVKVVKGKAVPAHPPGWSVRAVARRGAWPGLRYLEGVVEAPTMRHDGTVLNRAGYDPASGLVYDPTADFPELPENPTLDDAVRAADFLLDLVDDFPFAGHEHRVAWLAAILTVLARPAVEGPCPCFLFDASAAGSGKTLLAKLVGLIATGRDLPTSELSTDSEEVRKMITSVAIEGERVVLLDNASGHFGSAALDAALTSTSWCGRILGRSQRTADLPLTTVWLATGNNLKLVGDTHRRVILCRLEPDVEEPEKRDGFKIPDLLAHVRENRPALVVAGLTILLAHQRADRPQAKLPHFGSFESWSRVIRQAVYWVTTVDPCESRKGIEPSSKDDAGTLAAVLAGWEKLPGGDRKPGLTTKAALDMLKVQHDGQHAHPDLRAALAEWAKEGDLPDVKILGNRFRAAKGRVAGGRKLCSLTDDHTRLAGWWSEKVDSGSGSA